MKKVIAATVISAAALVPIPAHAAKVEGAKCKKPGATVTLADGSVLKCKGKRQKNRKWRLVSAPQPAKLDCVADSNYEFSPYTYGAVGESYNRYGILNVLGVTPTLGDHEFFYTATLEADYSNSAYPDSTKVVINGERVAWLDNTDAATLKPIVAGRTVPARIGWYNPDYIGVFLDMSEFCS